MGTKSKLNSDRFRSRTNLNSTIFSAFSDSPQVLDSPLGIKRIGSSLQDTLVEESPDRLHCMSGLERSVVPNSVQNTPDVSLSASDILKHDSMGIGETDEESTPAKSVSISKSESVVESILSDEEKNVSNSDDDMPLNNQPKLEMESDDNMALINQSKIEIESDDDLSMNNQSKIEIESKDGLSINNQSKIEIESDDDLSINNESKIEIESDDNLATFHLKKKPSKKAIIESDSESDNTDINSEEDAPRGVTEENGKKRKSDESSSLPQSKYVMLSSSDNEQSEDQEDMGSLGSGKEEETAIDFEMDSEDEDLQTLSEDLKEMYQVTLKKAKEFYRSSKYEECLANILQALEIYPENTALQAFALQVHSKMEG